MTSFTTIGAIWLVHHGMFRRLALADGVITRLNLLLLMLASFLPFPTKLVAEAVDGGQGERQAVMFYGLVLLSVSILITVMWRHMAAHRDLLNADVSDAEVAALTQQATPSIGFYAAIVLLSLVAPTVAAFGYLAIAVLVVFRSRGDVTAAAPEPGSERPSSDTCHRQREDATMGFLRNRDDAPAGRRFQMHEKLVSIGDDAWIEDEQGEKVYKVDGKALRARDTYKLEDRSGNEVAKIQEKKLSSVTR